MGYFYELSKKLKPTSFSAYHKMIKAVMKVNDIGSYHKLTAFLKAKSSGYTPDKAFVFKESEIEHFINEAADRDWLDVKVVCAFGLSGALRTDELVNIKIDDIERHGDSLMVVKIPKTKTKRPRSFTISGSFHKIVEKYASLRPSHVVDRRFVINYRGGRCTNQPIGRNKLSKMPERIAKFLVLPEAERYKGHSFRRSSASILANNGASMERIKWHGGWRSTTVAEGYVENSIPFKARTGDLITSRITSSTVTTTASQGYANYAVDDCENSFDELANIADSINLDIDRPGATVVDKLVQSSEIDDKLVQRSKIGDQLVQSSKICDQLVQSSESCEMDIEHPWRLDTSRLDDLKAKLREKNFSFKDCNITFNVL